MLTARERNWYGESKEGEMTLLKDELIDATGLTEGEIKEKLIKEVPEDSLNLRKARQAVAEQRAVEENSWGYITMLYAPSDCTLRDRMLVVLQ